MLSNNISGHDNTAVGGAALQANGVGALSTNTTGSFNTALGMSALGNNTIGYNNTAIGVDAMVNSSTGKFNVAIGNMAGSGLTTGSYNVDIGSPGMAGESNTIRIGTTGTHRTMVMAGITDATIPEGAAVVINRHGRMGVRTSSLRFNEAVKPMANASEVLLSLQPMTFRYKKELDPDAIPQFGLVAEQVAEIAPDLVARDDEGKAYTVRYEAVNAMLLNEFLKEHRKVEQLNETVSMLQKDLAQQRIEFVSMVAEQQKLQGSLATFEQQAAQIQKVSVVNNK
ncbi:MAG: tail fiber domain-containing protein [Ktedonobacteraceae bacterium]|nr:tail fiber domain-containing protein [Ktedonobacteraceae bacterium]